MTEHEVGGLFIDNHTTTLPLKKGLSSSAAVCVLARARRCRALRRSPRGHVDDHHDHVLEAPQRRQELGIQPGAHRLPAQCQCIASMSTFRLHKAQKPIARGQQKRDSPSRQHMGGAAPPTVLSLFVLLVTFRKSGFTRCYVMQVARAFNRIYNLRLSTRGEMQAAFEGERLTPSLCGKMDQVRAWGPALPLHAAPARSARSARAVSRGCVREGEAPHLPSVARPSGSRRGVRLRVFPPMPSHAHVTKWRWPSRPRSGARRAAHACAHPVRASRRQACAFGCRPVEMTFDGDVLHVAPIALAAPLHFVLVDLRAAKDTVVILERLQARASKHDSVAPL